MSRLMVKDFGLCSSKKKGEVIEIFRSKSFTNNPKEIKKIACNGEGSEG